MRILFGAGKAWRKWVSGVILQMGRLRVLERGPRARPTVTRRWEVASRAA